jgi:hypothetical protein
MKTTGLILGALVAGGVAYTIKGGCLNQESAPDERVAQHFTKMCEIARANIDTPERGVRKLGHYLDKNTGALLGDWGETFAAIERIPDDNKHDRRAEVARDRIRRPLIACARDWMRFGDAVEADPKANELVQRFNERLSRTFEIIFGEGGFDLKQLPLRIERTIDRR